MEALSAARAKEAADQAKKGADEYLSAVEKHIEGADHVTKHGAAVDVITEEADHSAGASTLIAMSTNGRSGLGRWI